MVSSAKASASINDEVKLTCAFDNPAALSASPSVTWYRNNTKFTSTDIDNSGVSGVSATSVYTMRSVSSDDQGYYKCHVSWNVGLLNGTSANVTQYVQTMYTSTAQSAYTFAGDTAAVTCSVGGGLGTIKWSYGNKSDVNFNSPSQCSENLTSHSGFYMQSVLRIARLVQAADAEKFVCTVTFDSGGSLSRNFDVYTVGKRGMLISPLLNTNDSQFWHAYIKSFFHTKMHLYFLTF